MERKAVVAGLLIAAIAACGQQAAEQQETGGSAPEAMPAAAPTRGSTEWKIQNALAAAPAEIAAGATVMDWPATEGGEPMQLQAGTNGWTCFPTTPQTLAAASGDDPMCLDSVWAAFGGAWAARKPPQVTQLGLGYMLQGDAGGSGTDPFAAGPTADNQWVRSGPHVMIVVPDTRILDALPGEPSGGGPWVMWKGTRWAHVMMPVAR